MKKYLLHRMRLDEWERKTGEERVEKSTSRRFQAAQADRQGGQAEEGSPLPGSAG